MQQQQQHVLALPQRKQMHPQRRLARQIKPRARRTRQRPRQRSFLNRRNRKPRARLPRIKDHLPRNTQRVREDRAKALVPLNQVAQRRLQRSAIQHPTNRSASGIV